MLSSSRPQSALYFIFPTPEDTFQPLPHINLLKILFLLTFIEPHLVAYCHSLDYIFIMYINQYACTALVAFLALPYTLAQVTTSCQPLNSKINGSKHVKSHTYL